MNDITQANIDDAYECGKKAWFNYYGSHGPTLKPNTKPRPINPFTSEKLREAWKRGYNQDTRRVIA